MKFWTLLAGLLVAGIVSSSLYAQDAPKKRGKRGGFQVTWADTKLADDGKLTQKIYTDTLVGKLPKDPAPTDDQIKRATDRGNSMFIRIAKAAGVTDATAETTLTKDQFEKGVAAVRAEFGNRKKKETT